MEETFLKCEVCGCSNLEWVERCPCTLNICGCYVERTGDDDAFWDNFFGLTDDK